MATPAWNSLENLGAEPQYNAVARPLFLLRQSWWRRSFAAARSYAPTCFPCALALTVGNIIVLAGDELMDQRLRALQSTPILTSTQPLLETLALALVVLVVSLSINLWALSGWLFRLTVFANAILMRSATVPFAAGNAEDLYGFVPAAVRVKSRKAYLGKVWLMASLFLLVPVLPFCSLWALKMVTGPLFVIEGEALVPLPSWLSPTLLETLTLISGAMVTLLVLSYSMTTLVFSAVSTLPARTTAVRALQQCWRNRGSVALNACMVSAMTALISAPLMVAQIWLKSSTGQLPLLAGCIGQVWLGLTSMIVWPWSLTPFCELMQASVEEVDRA